MTGPPIDLRDRPLEPINVTAPPLIQPVPPGTFPTIAERRRAANIEANRQRQLRLQANMRSLMTGGPMRDDRSTRQVFDDDLRALVTGNFPAIDSLTGRGEHLQMAASIVPGIFLAQQLRDHLPSLLDTDDPTQSVNPRAGVGILTGVLGSLFDLPLMRAGPLKAARGRPDPPSLIGTSVAATRKAVADAGNALVTRATSAPGAVERSVFTLGVMPAVAGTGLAVGGGAALAPEPVREGIASALRKALGDDVQPEPARPGDVERASKFGGATAMLVGMGLSLPWTRAALRANRGLARDVFDVGLRHLRAAGRTRRYVNETLDLGRSDVAGMVLDGASPATIRAMRTLNEDGTIQALHGTGSFFPEFDFRLIGTGQGAATFGHGHYFSETQEIVERYRDQQLRRDSRKRASRLLLPDGTEFTDDVAAAQLSSTEMTIHELAKTKSGELPFLEYEHFVRDEMNNALEVSNNLKRLADQLDEFEAAQVKAGMPTVDSQGFPVPITGKIGVGVPAGAEALARIHNIPVRDLPQLSDEGVELMRQLAGEGVPVTGAAEVRRVGEQLTERAEAGRTLLNRGVARARGGEEKGFILDVELKVDPEDLLDWDKPFREQSPKVQKALQGMTIPTREIDRSLSGLDPVDEPFSEWLVREQKTRFAGGGSQEDMTGAQIYSRLGLGSDRTKAEVTEALREAGIPGIRYLDGASRRAGEGTYNYVAFSDDIVTITKRNGQKVKPSTIANEGGAVTPLDVPGDRGRQRTTAPTTGMIPLEGRAERIIPSMRNANPEVLAEMNTRLETELKLGQRGDVVLSTLGSMTPPKGVSEGKGAFEGVVTPTSNVELSEHLSRGLMDKTTAGYTVALGQRAGAWMRAVPEARIGEKGVELGYVFDDLTGAEYLRLASVIRNDDALRAIDGSTFHKGSAIFRNFTELKQDAYEDLLQRAATAAKVQPPLSAAFEGGFINGSNAIRKALGEPSVVQDIGRVLEQRTGEQLRQVAPGFGDTAEAVDLRIRSYLDELKGNERGTITPFESVIGDADAPLVSRVNAAIDHLNFEYDPRTGLFLDRALGESFDARAASEILGDNAVHEIQRMAEVPNLPAREEPFQELTGNAVRELSGAEQEQIEMVVDRIRKKGADELPINLNLGRTVPDPQPGKPNNRKAAPNRPGTRKVTPKMINDIERMARGLLPDEVPRLLSNTGTALRAARRYALMPSVEHFEAMAMAGAAKRGWYRNSARTIRDVFGDDSPRFAAVLAAMSPQTSVEENLAIALKAWANWLDAGRPLDEAAIRKALLTTGGKEFEGRVSNVIRAMVTDDPSNLILNGPKVNSFNANLQDPATRELYEILMRTTLDTHMGKIARVPQSVFGADGLKLADGQVFAFRTKGGVDTSVRELRTSGFSPGYLAFTARVREATDALTARTGVRWTPREVQETVWSWIVALDRGAGKKGRVARAGGLGELLNQVEGHLNDVPTFDALMRRPKFAKMIEDLGLPLPGPQPVGALPEAITKIPQEQKLLRDMARAIEQSARENFKPLIAVTAGAAAAKDARSRTR